MAPIHQSSYTNWWTKQAAAAAGCRAAKTADQAHRFTTNKKLGQKRAPVLRSVIFQNSQICTDETSSHPI